MLIFTKKYLPVLHFHPNFYSAYLISWSLEFIKSSHQFSHERILDPNSRPKDARVLEINDFPSLLSRADVSRNVKASSREWKDEASCRAALGAPAFRFPSSCRIINKLITRRGSNRPPWCRWNRKERAMSKIKCENSKV